MAELQARDWTSEAALLEPPERVLSTLNRDGSRRWLQPRLSPGRFLRARRTLGCGLIAIFVLIPHLRLGGKPLILLDIPRRQFTFFGHTFLPTDTLLLALFLVGLIVGIFLVTAILGRVWCGWVCPQTVYMEFLFRPLERLLDGGPARGGRGRRIGWRTVVKYALYVVASAVLANTFLAYFVGVDALRGWVQQSPFEHPLPFLVMAVTTGLMLFDFSYFREQTCTLECPYGRFQSVMLDRDSLIIGYDRQRGEPRGPLRRKADDGARGDCIDCGLCVDTCPTGIDIRDGLQMECVACAQCIDACDLVMSRIRKPRGLIRYSSQARMAGQPSRRIRPRLILYPLVLLAIGTAFGTVLARQQSADVTILRGLGRPFVELPDGAVLNPLRLKIANRTDAPASYTVTLVAPAGAQLQLDEHPVQVAAGASRTVGLNLSVPRQVFRGGASELMLRISDGVACEQTHTYRLLGPVGKGADAPEQQK
jgi:cytochrome c oxidase accessory protein FixG